jgi:predicted nucleic acid-binding protein
VVVSTIVLTECLSKPLKEGDATLVASYNTLFRHTRGIALIPVHVTVAARAADLRARYALRTPDALHVATALVSGSDAFLTNDLALKRVREINVLVLDELELDTP